MCRIVRENAVMHESGFPWAMIGIYWMAAISPGPSKIVIIRNSLAISRTAGIYTSLGIVTGTFVHVTLGLLGVSRLIQDYQTVYTAVRLLGAGYLIFLGLSFMKYSERWGDIDRLQSSERPRLAAARAYRMGIFTHLSNAQAIVFYVSLFASFITPAVTTGMRFTCGVIMVATSAVWHPTLAVLVARPRFTRALVKHARHVEILFGALLLTAGIRMGYTVANLLVH